MLNTLFVVGWITRKCRIDSYNNPPVKEVDIILTRRNFLDEIKAAFPGIKNKKKFFINIWSTGEWDSMKRMPLLDTLIEPLNSEMAYVFVCDEKTDYAWRKLKEQTTRAKNFIYVNDQKDFIISVFQELKILNKKPYKWYNPNISLIMDDTGNIKFIKMYPIRHGKIEIIPGKSLQETEQINQKSDSQNYFHSIDGALSAIK